MASYTYFRKTICVRGHIICAVRLKEVTGYHVGMISCLIVVYTAGGISPQVLQEKVSESKERLWNYEKYL